MSAQVFQFPRYPAEQARRLARGSAWDRRWLVSLVGGLVLLLGGGSFWAFPPREVAIGLILAGLGLLVFSLVALGVWLWRVLRGPGRPWGRVLLLGLGALWVLSSMAVQQHAITLAFTLGALQWVFGLCFLLRLGWLARRRGPAAEAAIWAAGAAGEDLVAHALAQLGSDHVVIHNLPLLGRGDADHVVIGPAGVVVVETKYLAGRVTCLGGAGRTQARRDRVRRIADPATQVVRAAGAVQGKLRAHGLNVPVHSVLVLAHPRAELDVARSPVPVVRPAELVPLLRRLAMGRSRLDGPVVATVADVLLGAASATDSRR